MTDVMRLPVDDRLRWIRLNSTTSFVPSCEDSRDWGRRYRWCMEQFGLETDRWVSYGTSFHFRDQKDATLYRLAWGEDKSGG
jgi:hypothetical protein